MNYYEQLNSVMDFIGQHIDEEISLERLSDLSGISKFHFHRLFAAFMGLPLHKYIRWLRLKRAAHQLIFDKDQSIITIAINAGFESHEAFSRIFKKLCGMSPQAYRKGSKLLYWDKSPYCLPKRGEKMMQVELRNINKIRLAAIEHYGDPEEMAHSVNRLIEWAKAQAVDLKPKPGARNAFGIAYSDPNTTPAADFRMDFGLKVSENLKLEGGVVEKFLPAGRYVVAIHKGSRDNLGETVYALYREWLPQSGEELGDFPCVFCYLNFEQDVAETELLTECWLLLK